MSQQVKVYRALEFYPSGGGLRSLQITPQTNGARIESDDVLEFRDADLFIYSSTDGQLDIGADTTLTITAPTITIVGDIGLTGDIALADEDVSVAYQDYIYLDGDGGGEFLRSDATDYLMVNATTGIKFALGATSEVQLVADLLAPAVTNGCALGSTSYYWSDLFLASGGVVNFNNDVTLTHATDTLTIAGATSLDLAADTIYIGSTGEGKIVSADTYTTIYGGNTSADQVRLMGNSADAGPILYVVGNDRVYVSGKLQVSTRFYINSSMDMVQGQYLYFNGDGGSVNIRASGGADMTITASSAIILDATYVRLLTNDKFRLRDVDLYSEATGKLCLDTRGLGLNVVAISGNAEVAGKIDMTGTTSGEISMDTAVTGTYEIVLKDSVQDALSIKRASTDMMVFDTSGDAILCYPDFYMKDDAKLCLRDTNSYMQSAASGRMGIVVAGTTVDALSLQAQSGGTWGCVQIVGFLNLAPTTDVDSTNEGSVWYDQTTKKLHFHNGTAEQEVTSGGA